MWGSIHNVTVMHTNLISLQLITTKSQPNTPPCNQSQPDTSPCTQTHPLAPSQPITSPCTITTNHIPFNQTHPLTHPQSPHSEFQECTLTRTLQLRLRLRLLPFHRLLRAVVSVGVAAVSVGAAALSVATVVPLPVAAGTEAGQASEQVLGETVGPSSQFDAAPSMAVGLTTAQVAESVGR